VPWTTDDIADPTDSTAVVSGANGGLGLQQEFERHGARTSSFIAHPGLSHTNLQVKTVEEGGVGRSARFWMWLAATAGMSAAQGALCQLRAVTDPHARGALCQLRAVTDPHARGGEMYAPRFVARGAPVRRPVLRRGNDGAIATLWEVSERETGIAMDIGAAMTDT
jgi:hypothetical protein